MNISVCLSMHSSMHEECLKEEKKGNYILYIKKKYIISMQPALLSQDTLCFALSTKPTSSLLVLGPKCLI